MALTAAVSSFGTQYQLGDSGSPENFSTVAEIHDIPNVGSTYELHDATNQDSPNAYKEWIAGLLDNDEFVITMNYIPAAATQSTATGLRGQHTARTRKNHRIIWPTSPAATLAFAALVRKWVVNAPLDNILMANATIKPTGPLTLT